MNQNGVIIISFFIVLLHLLILISVQNIHQ